MIVRISKHCLEGYKKVGQRITFAWYLNVYAFKKTAFGSPAKIQILPPLLPLCLSSSAVISSWQLHHFPKRNSEASHYKLPPMLLIQDIISHKAHSL